MTSTAIAAENYRLKWDSHWTNLNMSLSNLLKNEKFADVILLSSSPEGGPGIPAHKVILTSCSSYFASIFDINPSTANGVVYIVLPSELSRRAIKILVQYMYNGETTVSNDILNEVLRGGEILKIRGLCRNNGNTLTSTAATTTATTATTNRARSNSSDSNNSNHHHYSHQHHCSTKNYKRSATMDNGIISTSLTANSNKILDRDKIQQQDQEHRNRRDSELRDFRSSSPIVNLPKESPVIVRSPKPTSFRRNEQNHYNFEASLNNIHPTPAAMCTIQNISIRKDVAIDPAEEYHTSSKYFNPTLNKVSVGDNQNNVHQIAHEQQQHQQHYSEPICKNYSSPIPSPISPTEIGRIQSNNEDFYDIQTSHQNHHTIPDDEASLRVVHRRRGSLPENIKTFRTSLLKKSRDSMTFFNERCSTDEANSNLSAATATVKQEPNDWTTNDLQCSNSSRIITSKQNLSVLNKIKTESIHSNEDENSDNEDNNTSSSPPSSYSPLRCELCSETFTVPKDWVRHIENHINTPPATHVLPKKKRKLLQEPEDDFMATLKCDLCSTYFETPAEWVRHIQNSHTETELAICNVEHGSTSSAVHIPPTAKKKKLFRYHQNSSEYEMYLNKTCAICNKKFPSYASMVIHSRTHTTGKS